MFLEICCPFNDLMFWSQWSLNSIKRRRTWDKNRSHIMWSICKLHLTLTTACIYFILKNLCSVQISKEAWNYTESMGPNIMALLTAEFCACDHYSPLTVQAPNFRSSCVSEECLVTWSTHAHKQKFSANSWNTFDVSKEFPASISADSLLMVSRAMKLGPGFERHTPSKVSRRFFNGALWKTKMALPSQR